MWRRVEWGCGCRAGDSEEHCVYCAALLGMARGHLRPDLWYVWEESPGSSSTWGSVTSAAFCLSCRVDATLMAYNGLRHARAREPRELYEGGPRSSRSGFLSSGRCCVVVPPSGARRRRPPRVAGS